MEGQSIPKATMANFIKNKTQHKVSADFIHSILQLSKDFIFRLTDKANQICQQKQKKTINTQHLYAALKQLKMEHHIQILKQSEKHLQQDNKAKQEYRQKVQQNLDLIMKKSSSMISEQALPSLQIRDAFEPMKYQKMNQQEDQEQNYEQIMEDQNMKEKMQIECKKSQQMKE